MDKWTQLDILSELRKMSRRVLKMVPATDEGRMYFEATVEKLLPQTRKVVASGEEHVPTLFIYSNPKALKGDTKERVAVVPITQFTSGTHKDVVAGLHRYIASAPFVRAVIFLVETWTLAQTAPEGEPHKMPEAFNGSIADHPDRREAVMYNMLYHDDNDHLQQMLRMYTKRGRELSDEDVMTIDPTGGPGGGAMHGRFVHENEEH
jgi:hypothetical protein